MIDFRDAPLPEGFRRILWAAVKAGDAVYLHCATQEGGVWAKGPYTVVGHPVLQQEERRIHEYGERLLVPENCSLGKE